MDTIKHQQMPTVGEEDNFLLALELSQRHSVPMVIRVAIELGVFDIIAKAGPGAQLSPKSIVSHLPTQNPNAENMLDRILRVLTSYNVLTSSVVNHNDGLVERLYGLAPLCKYFVQNDNGIVPFYPGILISLDQAYRDTWDHLKDAVLDGGIPFNKAHGMNVFEYAGLDSRFNKALNNTLFNWTTIVVKNIIETYKGFENLKEVVDLGGGIGITIGLITAKYPTIKGINFDLPHVIEHAPSYPGVEHVGGNMFESIPKSETIFMKWILHDWTDEICVKLLKNCYKALPDQGKLIVVDGILPVTAENNTAAKSLSLSNLVMSMVNNGKERTEEEFVTLAKEAGFASIKKVCCCYNSWVIEFHKE